ncbi:probable cytochrome P450 CYP44 [Rhodnius prolixus]
MLKYLKRASSTRKIPGPVNLPFLGSLWRYKLGLDEQSNYHETLDQLHAKYGPVVKQRLGAESIIHLFSPNDVSTIYATESRTPEIRPLQETVQLFRQKTDASLGLGNTNGEEWYKLRNALKTIMLTRSGMAHFTGGIESATDALIKKIKSSRTKDNTVPNFMTHLGAWTLESAGAMCFGKRMGFLEENEKVADPILKANRAVFYMSTHLRFSTSLYKYFNLPKWNCLVESENHIIKEIKRFTAEALEAIDKNPLSEDAEEDSYYLMRQLTNNKTLTRKDILVLMQSLFTDSLSTIVPTTIFCLYIMANEPEIQKKVYEETSKFVSKDAPITSKTLDKLIYSRGLIKETLRLYPNGTEISRILDQGLDLSGYHIPAEEHVNLNMVVLLKSDKEYYRPSEVLPERWSRSENSQKANPFILIPFGHGTRTCIGRRYAEQSMLIAMAKILQNFKLKYKSDVQPLKQVYNILMYPTDTRGLVLEPRN